MKMQRKKGPAAGDAGTTVQGLAFISALCALTTLSIALPDRSNRNGNSDSSNNFVSPRYAVIDLGVGILPKKITDTSYVLLSGGTNNYRWNAGNLQILEGENDPPPDLDSLLDDPSQTFIGKNTGVADIGEDGTVVGSQLQYEWEYDNGFIVGAESNPDSGTFIKQAIWTGTSTAVAIGAQKTPFQYSPDLVPVSENAAVGISQTATWSQQSTQDNEGADFAPLTFASDTFRNDVEVGSEVFTNPTGGTYGWYESYLFNPAYTFIAVNKDDQELLQASCYGNTGEPLGTSGYYLGTNQLLPFRPTGLSNRMNLSANVGGPTYATYVIGMTTNSPSTPVWWDGATVYSVIGGTPTAINASTSTVTVESGTVVVPTSQMVGGNMIWNMINGQFSLPQSLDSLIPRNSGWSGISTGSRSINDSGVIVGTASYTPTGTADPIPAGQHAVMLVPCQFALLNGSQSGPDGKDFDGNRPRTLDDPDIAADNSSTGTLLAVAPDTLGSLGIQEDADHITYQCSALMTAKVSRQPNITYSWSRTIKRREVIIVKSADDKTWNVTCIVGNNTPQTDNADPVDETTTPSAKGILYCFDDPGTVLDYQNQSCHTGDYDYREDDFIYTLTVTIGSVSVPFPQHVGMIALAQRTDNSGNHPYGWMGVPTDQLGITLHTFHVPDCVITEAKIRSIVGNDGRSIHFVDPNVNADIGD